MTNQYLNLGCGTITLPCERPAHHGLVSAELYEHPDWLNVDKVDSGADELVDVFRYPWPWPDNTFGGALLAHIVEHIPHEISMRAAIPVLDPSGTYTRNAPLRNQIEALQDGWYAFFAELWRVLKPDAVAHVLVPHGASDGALADPTHTRYVMPHTFDYFDTGGSFEYKVGSKWQMQQQIVYNLSDLYRDLYPAPDDDVGTVEIKNQRLSVAMMTQRNVCYEFYVRLRAVKDATDTN